MSEIEYPASWYAATVKDLRPRPPLDGDLETDVCVIGAGLAGLSVARELQRRGKAVVVLEARRIGWGASGRNGGFVTGGFAEYVPNLVARLGLDHARALYGLSVEGPNTVRETVAQLDPALKAGEGLIVALRHRDRQGLERYAEMMRQSFGRPIEILAAETLRQWLHTDRYYAGLLDRSGFHIHPLNYALALAQSFEALGGRIHESTEALASEGRAAAWCVKTRQGNVTAQHIVHCTSAGGRTIDGRLGRALLPVATYVAVTEPLGDRAHATIATEAAVADTRRAGDYYRLVEGDRILWGGRITTRLSEPRRLAEMMRNDMLGVYPQLGTPRIDYAWGGIMGYALHKMPIIGPLGPGQWAATAFGGHGLNTSAMAGSLIAGAITDGDDRWKLFAPFGLRWAGGPFGRAGVQLSYWHMQLKDRIEESKARVG